MRLILRGLLTSTAALTLSLALSGQALADDGVICDWTGCHVEADHGGQPSTPGDSSSGQPGSDGSGGGTEGGEYVPPPPMCTGGDVGPCTPPCVGDGVLPGGASQDCTPGDPGTPPPPPDLPTPGEVADDARKLLPLPAPVIGIVPEPGSDRMGLVGMPVYLWTQDQTWGTASRTATAGPISVTATARVSRVVWDMGNGDKVTCTTPGTPYQSSFQANSSPDCGYKYVVPGEFDVTATATYSIAWHGATSGTDVESRSSSVRIRVGEMQAIVQ